MKSLAPTLPRRATARLLLTGLLTGLIAAGTPALAQPAGCDEGVIRLPDRSGTIQICSALAAKVPELARQLTQATAALGSQQAQIAELTRLVRGLNNVSRSIGVERQAKMMQSLSSELETASSGRSGDALARINERLDGLQASLLGALSDPKMASALGDALKGPVGEAIARLDLGGASRQIDDISERLKALQSSVGEVRADTTAIRQQIAQMDQRQQAVEGAREQRETVTIDLLKRLSGQIRDLGQRGGLIDNAKTYAEHYHNARILAQRGETDLAMASYREVFKTGVQMADPVIDLTTLLTRQYGRKGAEEALKRDFQKQLPTLSYLYGLQLLADREVDDVEALLFKAPQRVAEFPPLASIYLRRLHERLARERVNRITPYTFQWSDTAGMGAVAERVDKEIQSGNYLAFYIDPIRANRDLDDFRSVSDHFARDKILKVNVPNLAHPENFVRQTVDLMRGPVGLDYTYLLDPPTSETLGALAREMAYWPRYKPGSVFLFIWDRAVDTSKPIQVCTGGAGAPQCRNLNTTELRCKSSSGTRANECLREHTIGHGENIAPRVEAHFIAKDLLGSTCVSRVRYTTRSGQDISIDTRDLIAVSRRAPDDELRRAMGACGYDLQNQSPARDNGRRAGTSTTGTSTPGKPAATATPAAFAAAVQADRPVTYNQANCERVGYLGSFIMGMQTLGTHQTSRFLLKIGQALQTLPEIPAPQDRGYTGFFDETDKRCKVRVISKGKAYACGVEKIVRNRWRPAPSNAPADERRMLSPSDIFNGSIYADLSEPVRCVLQADQAAALQSAGSAAPRSVASLDLLENSDIEHALEAFGAGHSPQCDTKGYLGITHRIRVDLGLRAMQQEICPLKETPRKAKIDAARSAHAPTFQGCFTESGMRGYQEKSQQWLASTAKECASPQGKLLAEYMAEASEWALSQP